MLARFSFPIPLPPDPSRPSPTSSLRLPLRSPALLLVRRRLTIYFRRPENSGTDSGEAARASEMGNRRWIGWKMGLGALSEGDEVEFEEKWRILAKVESIARIRPFQLVLGEN